MYDYGIVSRLINDSLIRRVRILTRDHTPPTPLHHTSKFI